MSRRTPRTVRTTIAGIAGGLVTSLVVLAGTAAPASADNVTTPGDFTGYGFDQCLAPTQKSMNVWLKHSPFLSAGIYISGDSRACRNQPNLTPAWIRKQLARGWRLLPITLGPQASCQPRFPRYGDDKTINPKPGKNSLYRPARRQARAEAVTAVEAAQDLGIVAGSTLWYDLEGFDSSNTHCRESALAFLSAWTTQLHKLDYISGVYSSVGSGIAALDDARVNRPGKFTLPDQIWMARWDGVANTSSSYIREDGWRPHARVKQYQGGHDETWGGVRINIDRNFLDVGRGSWAPDVAHCTSTRVDFAKYDAVRPATDKRTSDAAQVLALQCLLKEHEPLLRQAQRQLQQGDRGGRERLAGPARLRGAAQLLPVPLGLAALRRPEGRAQVRLRRGVRTTGAAGPERSSSQGPDRGQRRLRPEDRRRAAGLAEAGRLHRQWRRDRSALGGAPVGQALSQGSGAISSRAGRRATPRR